MGTRSAWMPGAQVTLRGVGYKVFWAYPTIVVQDTPGLIALYLPAGVAGKNTQKRPTPRELLSPDKINIVDHKWERTDVLMLIIPGEAFSTYAMWKTGTRNLNCWYINLQEPIRRTSIGFDTMDNMLDVVVSPDLCDWKWKDEDEIAEAERVGFYSHDKAEEIRAEGKRAIRLVTSERRSWYKQWENWQPQPGWKISKLSPLWDKMDLTVD